MNRTLQIVLTLAFVVVLGAVLIQPILDAVESTDPLAASIDRDDRGAASPEPEAPETSEPTVSPSEGSGSGAIEGPLRRRPLFDVYPSQCLEVATPVPDRLVLVRDGVAETTTGFRSTPAQGRIAAVGLVGLDAGAQTFATYVRPRDVLFSPWEGVAGADGLLTGPRVRLAAWSPVSSCGLTLTRAGRLTVVPEDAVLVRQHVTGFAYSADGRRVALVLDEGETTSIWVTDPAGARMREIYRVQKGAKVRLEGWSPDGKTLYFSQDQTAAVAFVTTGRRPESGPVGSTGVVQIEHCSGRLLGVLENGVIAEIEPGGATPITGGGFAAVSCAPNGAFMAAIQDDSLVLLDRDGRTLRNLTTDEGYRDDFVDWGSGGAGLLFGRQPDDGRPAELWHIPEGGTARATGLVYSGPASVSVDWSASPPTGLP